MRIDKFLAHTGYGSRKDVKVLIKKGRVSVGNEIVTRPEHKVNECEETVFVDGEAVEYVKYVYVMMNKPPGVISATSDPYGEDVTVSELACEVCGIPDLFPVGRLDKDATGLIILTNDGIFAHRAASPKKNAKKVYEVEVSGDLTENDAEAFRRRVTLDDGYLCRESELCILESGESSRALVTLTEGKFHQVKRMFQALTPQKHVTSLKRISFCGISLPADLPEGSARPLTEDEMEVIAPYIAGE